MNRTSSGNAFRGRCFFMWNYILAGGCAGIIAGLFGAGGGLVLVPLLRRCGDLASDSVFPASVATILPICMMTILVTAGQGKLPVKEALPYLVGSGAGGILAGIFGRRIPVLWLHRILGLFILWGGIRNLCRA